MSDRIQLIAMRLRDLRDISGMSVEEVAEKSESTPRFTANMRPARVTSLSRTCSI